MIYKPQAGKMKDNCMYYSDGKYYHYSMYCKTASYHNDNGIYNNVFLAISNDGVHFQDYGCVVEDFPKYVWAMKVYRGEDAYYMNSGSFTDDNRQAVLKFWRSFDLVHWEYCPELDLTAPSDQDVRLDCMNVIKIEDKYYGYATGDYRFWMSADGTHWNLVNGEIDSSPLPQDEKHFEIADCVSYDGEFYLLSGAFGHIGIRGYGVYLYKSVSPLGPFRPILSAYRINGTSLRWVNMWERCFEKDGELLAHNYMYDGYSYECGSSYLPPIKKVEKHGEGLRLRWWEENRLLYGQLLFEKQKISVSADMVNIFGDESKIFQFGDDSVSLPETAIIECKFKYQPRGFTKFPKAGILLLEKNGYGTALLFDAMGKFEIARTYEQKIEAIEDTVGYGSCAPYWIQSGEVYSIRILCRRGLFEIYVNDLYLQTFNNAHFSECLATPFEKFTLISVSGNAEMTDIAVYAMEL
jgi:sucrose-6-phosphate hydrolase SacC (GH32 family)